MKLQGSWLLAAILIIAHAAAVGLMVIVSMPAWLKLIIVAAIVLSCLFSVRQAAFLLMPYSTVALSISSDNLLSVQTRGGDWIQCEVLGSTYVASFLTVLNLRHVGQRSARHVVILPDGIGNEDFRLLRVWLRWRPSSQSGR